MKRSRARVYVVEDQQLIREMLCARLEVESEAEVVGQSGDAEHALTELESLDVDVVLMDIELPGVDGIEATRRLKDKRPDLAVVMLTSYQDEHLEEAISAGALGYILKTSSGEQLIQAVRAAQQGLASLDPSLTSRLFRQVDELRKSSKQSFLTDRQVAILRLVASGTRYSVIAGCLFVSETTVNREMRAIFNRLGVNDAAHAVSKAHEEGIL